MTAHGPQILAADAAIDLQTHTLLSDGRWTPVALLDHAAQAQFSLLAITDHDRPDTVGALQELAQAAGVALLVAAEMTTTWRDGMVDVLCFGFDPAAQPLQAVARDLW